MKPFKLIILILFIACSFAPIFSDSNAFAARVDSGLWLHPFVKMQVNDNWGVTTSSEIRTHNNFEGFNQVLFHLGAVYHINDHFDALAGVTYMGTHRNNLRDEYRPWQAVKFHGDLFNQNVFAQQKFEERFYPGFNQVFSLRSRTLAGWKYDLMQNHHVQLVVSDEIFFTPNQTDWGSHRWFDQNRFKVGLKFDAFKNTPIQVSYMNQHFSPKTGQDINYNLLVLDFGLNIK